LIADFLSGVEPTIRKKCQMLADTVFQNVAHFRKFLVRSKFFFILDNVSSLGRRYAGLETNYFKKLLSSSFISQSIIGRLQKMKTIQLLRSVQLPSVDTILEKKVSCFGFVNSLE